MTTIFKILSLILYHPFLTNQVALPLERSHMDALPNNNNNVHHIQDREYCTK